MEIWTVISGQSISGLPKSWTLTWMWWRKRWRNFWNSLIAWYIFYNSNCWWSSAVNTWSFAVDGRKWVIKIGPTVVHHQYLDCQLLIVRIHQHITINSHHRDLDYCKWTINIWITNSLNVNLSVQNKLPSKFSKSFILSPSWFQHMSKFQLKWHNF